MKKATKQTVCLCGIEFFCALMAGILGYYLPVNATIFTTGGQLVGSLFAYMCAILIMGMFVPFRLERFHLEKEALRRGMHLLLFLIGAPLYAVLAVIVISLLR